MLESLGEARLAVDAGGRITSVNRLASRILGGAPGALLGRVLWHELPAAAAEQIRGHARAAADSGSSVECEAVLCGAAPWRVRIHPAGDGFFIYLSYLSAPAPVSADPDVPITRTAAGAMLLDLPVGDAPLRALGDALPYIVWLADTHGRLDYLNVHWFAYTGLREDEAYDPTTWLRAVHPEDRSAFEARWRAARQKGEAGEFAFRLRRGADGSYRWHLGRAVPVRDREGRIVKWFGTSTDIDDQQRAEEGLRFLARASEALTVSLDYEATLTSIARLAVPVLADWCIVDELEEDGAFRRMAIVHADPAKAELAWEMERRFPTDPGGRIGPAAVLRSGRPELYPVVSHDLLVELTESGEHLALLRRLGFHSYVCVPLIARGRTIGALTFISGDAGEAPRRYGPQDLALLEDLAHRAALAVDNARLYEAEQQARRAAERSAGRTARLQAVTAALSEALTPAQVAHVIVAQTMAALRADAAFVALLGEDGAVTVVEVAGTPIDLEPERRTLTLDAALPLSDAMRAREPLWLDSAEMLTRRYPVISDLRVRTGRAALACIPLLVEGRVVGGLSMSFPEARTFTEEDRALALALARQCAQALERSRLYDAERAARAAAEAAATEVKRTQERVIESERLRALGELASGIAHDFNNILAVILGRCEVLLAGDTASVSPGEVARHFEVVRQAARDGEATVKRLQAFSGINRAPSTGAMDVPAIVRDVVEYTRPRWKDEAQQRGVTVQMQIEAPTLPPIVGDPSELREVLVNMLFNALDAMPHGGTIQLSVRRNDGEVIVRIADTGLGMTEAVRKRIFEPFYTTKGQRGAGLGLSMSYGIVTRMGGHIDVHSTPGEGTAFTITLPFREAPPEEQDGRIEFVGPLSILLVDDEALILETTQLMLELDGHQVTTADSGAEALALLRESAEPGEAGIYDAVLTDLGMPGMNGLQLLAAIRAAGYTLPCLLVTGWGAELAGTDVEAAGAQAVLPKPFSIQQLRQALGAVMPVQQAV
ncbi:MAG TPA: ATP-binding protein [Dehalococcoidia bacterium]|nr:ATP-binding protein [Dehalococcoidia bacterium]